MTQSKDFASSLFTELHKSGPGLDSSHTADHAASRKERPAASRKLETRRAIEDYIELKRLHTTTDDYAFDLD